MRKIIIGIHGLGNKPPRRILKTWWKKSIKEGLVRIGSSRTKFKFDLVYWADLLHEKPLNLKMRDSGNPLFLEDPYTPGEKDVVIEQPSKSKKEFLNKLEKKMDDLFFKEESLVNFDKIADLIIKNFFKDLAVYYREDSRLQNGTSVQVKKRIRNCLSATLQKYKNYDILLIAHSMGSIIAYDVLSQNTSDFKINTLITIGSPLGLPVVIKKILKEQHVDYKADHRPPTPENIKKHWYNFSDLDDKIAINYNLADDYKKNSDGAGPVDFIVDNDYEYKEHKNPHKSYGYLRTLEVAKGIDEFLQPGKENFWDSLRQEWAQLRADLLEKIRSFTPK